MKPEEISRIYQDGRHYDRLFGPPHLPFWLEMARQTGGPVLELGCGTGKISIPIAEAGFEVWGIDISEPMLQEGRNKTSSQKLPLMFLRGDITDFALNQRFNLILLPSNNICHLLSATELERCLQRVREHLSVNGLFVIDVFVPNIRLLSKPSDFEEIMSEYEDPDGNGRVVIATSSTYEPDTQIRRNTTFQRIQGRPEVKGNLDLKMWFPQELDAILRYNGFEIISKYGDYEKKPFNRGSNKQLLIARAK